MKTFPQISLWGSCQITGIQSFPPHYNILILRKVLPRKPRTVHSLYRDQLYLIGLCVLGLLHSFDSKNTKLLLYAFLFSLLYIFLAKFTDLQTFPRIYYNKKQGYLLSEHASFVNFKETDDFFELSFS